MYVSWFGAVCCYSRGFGRGESCAYLWLAAPERVSLRMEGGVKTTELSSVPSRLLLGVSAKILVNNSYWRMHIRVNLCNLPGLVKLASLPLESTFPDPDVAVAVVAPQASEALRDFLASGPDFLLGEEFSLLTAVPPPPPPLAPPMPLSWWLEKSDWKLMLELAWLVSQLSFLVISVRSSNSFVGVWGCKIWEWYLNLPPNLNFSLCRTMSMQSEMGKDRNLPQLSVQAYGSYSTFGWSYEFRNVIISALHWPFC